MTQFDEKLEDEKYRLWLLEHKWVCECGLEYIDMEKAEDHQCKTDHCMERVKRTPDAFDTLIKSHGL